MMNKKTWATWMAVIGVAFTLLFMSMLDHNRKQSPIDNKTEMPNSMISPNSAHADAVPASVPETFADVASKIEPAVVNIYTTSVVEGSPDPFWRNFQQQQQRTQQSLGSGFVIDPEGDIITNAHVVEGADEIKVQFANQKTYIAKLVGSDSDTDIALIRVEANIKFPSAPLGNSDALRVGDWVLAAGNPFGLSNTVTAGIVSAKGRFIGNTAYDNLIQTDASINPGNSGGPLVNIKGEVVGINQSIFSRSGGNIGIGFAIPINLIKPVIAQLKDKGTVTRAWLGVKMQHIDENLATSFGLEKPMGALVNQVVPGGPAEKAGVLEGDVIIAINDDEVEDQNELMRQVSLSPVGSQVKLTIVRDKKKLDLTVTLTERPDNTEVMASGGRPGVLQDDKLGLAVSAIPPNEAARLGIPGGVLVVGVKRDGVAARGGVAKGDIILKINTLNVTNVGEYKNASMQLKRGVLVRMQVRRENAKLFLAFVMP